MKLSKINFNEVQIPSRIQPIDVVSCDVKTFKELREDILGSWKRRYLRHHSEGTVVTILDYDKVYEEEHHGFTLTLILCEVNGKLSWIDITCFRFFPRYTTAYNFIKKNYPEMLDLLGYGNDLERWNALKGRTFIVDKIRRMKCPRFVNGELDNEHYRLVKQALLREVHK
jgi:hypothetical protein